MNKLLTLIGLLPGVMSLGGSPQDEISSDVANGVLVQNVTSTYNSTKNKYEILVEGVNSGDYYSSVVSISKNGDGERYFSHSGDRLFVYETLKPGDSFDIDYETNNEITSYNICLHTATIQEFNDDIKFIGLNENQPERTTSNMLTYYVDVTNVDFLKNDSSAIFYALCEIEYEGKQYYVMYLNAHIENDYLVIKLEGLKALDPNAITIKNVRISHNVMDTTPPSGLYSVTKVFTPIFIIMLILGIFVLPIPIIIVFGNMRKRKIRRTLNK